MKCTCFFLNSFYSPLCYVCQQTTKRKTTTWNPVPRCPASLNNAPGCRTHSGPVGASDGPPYQINVPATSTMLQHTDLSLAPPGHSACLTAQNPNSLLFHLHFPKIIPAPFNAPKAQGMAACPEIGSPKHTPRNAQRHRSCCPAELLFKEKRIIGKKTQNRTPTT